MASRKLLHATIAATLLWSAAPAAAQVTFVPDRGRQITLSTEQVAQAADVSERQYTIRTNTGGESTVTVSGASLGALLRAADVDLVPVGYVEVLRPDGSPLLLSPDQASGDDAFPEGPPVVSPEGSGVSFLRPSGGDSDANADDRFSAPGGLTVRLRRGKLLDVSADAAPRRVDPRDPVTFTANAERSGAGEQLRYRWYFNDGRGATGSTVTHRFAKPGSYGVVVTVTTPSDDTGASDVLRVQVGEPKQGPDRQGGGENRDAGAPDSGPGDAGGSEGGQSGAGDGSAEGDDSATAADEAPARKRREQDNLEPGERVEGELLSTASQPPEPPSAAPGARTGREIDEDGFAIPAAGWGGLAALALMMTGAALELRVLPSRKAVA